MVLHESVLDAFNVLGIAPDTPEEVARNAYKKLALIHHPDRNRDDPSATQHFQKIGGAWNICQRHYNQPSWSLDATSSRFQASGRRTHDPYDGPRYSYDDDIPLDDEEAKYFFRFMFEEMLHNRFSYARGQRFREQRRGAAGGGVYAFSGDFAESRMRQEENNARQRRENEAYLERVLELEREIAAEQHEKDRIAREGVKQQQRLTMAYQRAFSLGREGNGDSMKALIEEYKLDVKAPEKQRKEKQNQKPATEYETMLHIAARSCNEDVVLFLVNKGANPAALNVEMLTPFHVSLLSGNQRVARWFFEQQRRKPMEGCHLSKAATDTARRTPLQLALAGGVPEIVQMLINDATVHDVRRCWHDLAKQLASAPTSDERTGRLLKIKDMFLKKKGFSPDNQENAQNQVLSKKALRKAAQAKAEADAATRKAKLRAEEEARIAAKRAEEESRKRMVEEQMRQRTAEAEAHRIAEERDRKQAEAEAKARKLKEEEDARQEACRLAEEVRRAAEREASRLEEQRRRTAETEAHMLAEEASRLEEKRRRTEETEAHRLIEEARKPFEREARQQEESKRAVEREARRTAREVRRAENERRKAAKKETHRLAEQETRKLEDERRRVAKNEAQRLAEETRLLEEHRRKMAEEEARQRAEEEARRLAHRAQMAAEHDKRSAEEAARSKVVPSQEKAKRSRRKAKTAYMDNPSLPDPLSTQERIAARRAEQSAKDKARHRRLLEEKKLAAIRVNAESDRKTTIQQTNRLLDDSPNRLRPLDHAQASSLSPTSVISDFPRTPTSEVPPGFLRIRPNIASLDAPFSPTWTTDQLDIQTCTIPESLFAYQPPQPVASVTISPASSIAKKDVGNLAPESQANKTIQDSVGQSLPSEQIIQSTAAKHSRGGRRRGWGRSRGQRAKSNGETVHVSHGSN